MMRLTGGRLTRRRVTGRRDGRAGLHGRRAAGRNLRARAGVVAAIGLTLTGCGTGSPSITGTDNAGTVVLGTSATACTITFNKAYTSAPFCVVVWTNTPLASESYTVSNTAIVLTQTSTSGDRVEYICIGQNSG